MVVLIGAVMAEGAIGRSYSRGLAGPDHLCVSLLDAFGWSEQKAAIALRSSPVACDCQPARKSRLEREPISGLELLCQSTLLRVLFPVSHGARHTDLFQHGVGWLTLIDGLFCDVFA